MNAPPFRFCETSVARLNDSPGVVPFRPHGSAWRHQWHGASMGGCVRIENGGDMTASTTPEGLNLKPYRPRQQPFPVGSVRQPLFDDTLLAMAGAAYWDQLTYGVRFSLGQVNKHGGPVMVAGQPWETGTAWLNLIKEGGRYRLWYNSYQADKRGLRVSYAESEDGLHFTKPRLGLIDVGGSRNNNVVFDGGFLGISPELGNVFYDPHGDPDEAYKMVYAEWHSGAVMDLPWQAGGPTASNGSLRAATSPDGIHWTRYLDNFLSRYPDSQNVACWDASLERYVIYYRTTSRFAAVNAGALRVSDQLRGRAIGRVESEDFRRWSSPEVALGADLDDGLNTDIYNSGYSRHPENPNAHYFFPSFYRHYEGTFEVQVATSRDNRTWARPCRDTFVPLGAPGEFDCFILSVAPGFVSLDDDTWALYYRSGDGPHGGSHPITLDYKAQGRMSRVTFKRERILGIEGNATGGHFSTRPLSFAGNRLVVNAEPTGPNPELRFQLLSAETNQPLPGYTFDDCQAIHGDVLDGPVVWNGSAALGPDVPRAAVRLHCRVRDMRVYAFQFLP